MALNPFAFSSSTLIPSLMPSGDDKVVFESSEAIKVVRNALQCSFLTREG